MRKIFEKTSNIQINDLIISYSIVINNDETTEMLYPHYHSNYEIQYPINSKWYYFEDKKKKKAIIDSHVCMIPPYKYHYLIPERDNSQKMAIKFSFTSKNKKSTTLKLINDSLDIFSEIELIKISELNLILDLLVCEINKSKKNNDYLLASYVTNIIFILINHYHEKKSYVHNKNSKRNDKSNAYYGTLIENSIFHKYQYPNYSLQQLSKEIGVCERHTERLCKEIFNLNFKELLLQTRMNNAVELINKNTVSYTEIGQLVGYNSYVGFYKAFKKYFGIEPTKYNKKDYTP